MPTNLQRGLMVGVALFAAGIAAFPQTSEHSSALTPSQAIELAHKGHCKEALPTLKRAIPQLGDKVQKYNAELSLLRCAMALDQEDIAASTLLRMKREEPDNPEVLYLATHYFSELGMRAAQQLQAKAPGSYQGRRLEAEALESSGKSDEAEALYRKILEENQKIPGIHYRLGQIALDRAGANGSTDEAKREFQAEVEVDPSNASAQFVLGELARRGGNWDEAISRFSQAAKLDSGFSEAYLALGMSLAGAGKFSQATAPLETYVKQQPDDPAGHYQLALAYSRTGNKQGAEREMALQAQAARRVKPTDTTEGQAIHP